MAGDAEATRRRLLDAAAKEFAEYGIAGARVDRIAAEAKSNKAQIYHYFTNKDGLFDAVMRELAGHTVREAPIDAADLPEYAGRLYDRFAADPVMARLANWYRLEGSGYAAVDLVVASTRDKLAAVTKAQEEGLIPDRFHLSHGQHIRLFGESGITNRRMGALGSVVALRANGGVRTVTTRCGC